MIDCCVIGNSHLAAIKLGWDQVHQNYPGVAASMFGSGGKHLSNTRLAEGNRLELNRGFLQFPARSDTGRVKEINLNAYNCFVIVGSGFGMKCVLDIYMNFSFYGLNAGQRQVGSRDLFRNLAMQAALQSSAFHVCNLVRSASKAPIFMIPVPLPSQKGYWDKEKRPRMVGWQECEANNDGEPLVNIFAEVRKNLFSGQLYYVDQAHMTKAGIIATKQEYSDNSVRMNDDFDIQHPAGDCFHMNPGYGALMWEELVTAMRVLPELSQ